VNHLNNYTFIKEILGVHCKATNAVCLAELNRYPLRGRIQLATIKFLEHILSLILNTF
jgi:hypothetical protein